MKSVTFNRDRSESTNALLARIAELEAATDIGRELMRRAWHEFNAIRARDGAPPGVSPEYWDEMVEDLSSMLGDDTKPWMLAGAKKYVDRIAELEAADAEDNLCLRTAIERNAELEAEVARIKELASAQAEDGGLWFATETAAEAYLQQELRKLHAAIEGEQEDKQV